MSDFDFDIDINELRERIKEDDNPKFEDDDTKFNPAKQMKVGDEAIVRVMPRYDNKHWSVEHIYHQLNGKGRFYTCPQQFDHTAKCPFCEKSKTYYDRGDTETGAKFWKKRRFGAFVRVKNAEELGLTNLDEPTVWWYGKTIESKFKAAIEDDEIGAFFHPIEGYDFKLRRGEKKDYPNYDSSDFARAKTKLHDNEKVIKALFEARHDLVEDIEPALSYEELSDILNGNSSVSEEDDREDAVENGTTARLPETKEEAKEDASTTDDDADLQALLAKINS